MKDLNTILNDYEKLLNYLDEDRLGQKYETDFYRNKLKNFKKSLKG